MNDESSLSHTRWECKYDIVWIPKYRKKTLFGELRKYLGQVFRDLARSRESEVIEGHLHATTWARREILQGINSGPEDISYRQLVVMRKRFENICKRKKRRTVD